MLTPRLEKIGDTTKEAASPLIIQVWKFMQKQLDQAERREMTVGTFASFGTTISFFR